MMGSESRCGCPARSWRSAVFAVFVSVILLASAGCSYLFQPTLTEKDVIGTWVGSGGARLTLAQGETMTGVRVPFEIEDPDHFSRPWTGRGGWHIETGSNAIVLIVDTWADANVPVLYENGNWTIVFFIGDPDKDRRYNFHKVSHRS